MIRLQCLKCQVCELYHKKISLEINPSIPRGFLSNTVINLHQTKKPSSKITLDEGFHYTPKNCDNIKSTSCSPCTSN